MNIKDKILIVEDEKSISGFIRAILVSNGYDVVIAHSGSEAFSMISSHCPDLVVLDLGLPDMDFSPVAELCEKHGIKYHIEKTQIYEVVFEARKESNPCSLCSKMRRGVLHETAKRLGATKIALGHHNDDVVETFMLNLFYEGRLGCFSPKTYLSRTDITVIRPFVYLLEKEIKSFTKKVELPVVESTCPADKDSERKNMKDLLAVLDKENRGLRTRIFGAICRGEIDGFAEFTGKK